MLNNQDIILNYFINLWLNYKLQLSLPHHNNIIKHISFLFDLSFHYFNSEKIT